MVSPLGKLLTGWTYEVFAYEIRIKLLRVLGILCLPVALIISYIIFRAVFSVELREVHLLCSLLRFMSSLDLQLLLETSRMSEPE